MLATGDTFRNDMRYQNIDFANGGDVRGMIRALNTYLQVANDNTKIVPGHGALATKADLVKFRDMLVTSRDRIEKLFNEGKTEEEVIALKPLADLDATWSGNAQQAIGHTRKRLQTPSIDDEIMRLGSGCSWRQPRDGHAVDVEAARDLSNGLAVNIAPPDGFVARCAKVFRIP